MVALEENYERSLLRKARQRAKKTETPQLAGKFYVLHFNHSGSDRQQKTVRYALSKEHAIAKVKETNPGCELSPIIQCSGYEQAVTALTVRTGCLTTILNSEDSAELGRSSGMGIHPATNCSEDSTASRNGTGNPRRQGQAGRAAAK